MKIKNYKLKIPIRAFALIGFLFAVISFALNAQGAAPASGLVGYWNFDEGAGTTARDSSGNGNTGTLTNGPAWTTGKVGSGAIGFDGVDDKININNTFSSVTGTDAKTISLWAKPISAAGTHSAFMLCKAASTRGFGIELTNTAGGRWGFLYRATGDVTATIGGVSVNATLNSWTHLAFLQNGTSVIYYINGIQAGSAANAADTLLPRGGMIERRVLE